MQQKPNVIIIMADQLRYDAIGPYTPNINFLAEESVIFTRAYCSSPLCIPARGSFFTGLYPNISGCIINGFEETDIQQRYIKNSIPNLYTVLEKTWNSWHIGKQHFCTQDKIDENPYTRTKWIRHKKEYFEFLEANKKNPPGGAGYRAYVPEMASGKITRVKEYSKPAIGRYEDGEEYFTDIYFTNKIIEAIRNRDTLKPLLINAMFHAPHPPFQIPEPWYSKVKEVDLPKNVAKWSIGQSPLQLYNLSGFIGSHYSYDEWKEIWKVYLGLVSLLDDCIGKIIDELKRQNLYENSLIIFTSDHGEMLGSHRLWQKMCMYEEAVRTPLFIKFPKSFLTKVNEVNELVSSIDIFPTICDFLGIKLEHTVSGTSLMPVVNGEKLNRNKIFIQFDGNGARGNFQRCVIEDQYKLIVDIFKDERFIELYDVLNDEQESYNLSLDKKYKPLIEKLLNSLRLHMNETGDLLKLPLNIYEKFRKENINEKTFPGYGWNCCFMLLAIGSGFSMYTTNRRYYWF